MASALDKLKDLETTLSAFKVRHKITARVFVVYLALNVSGATVWLSGSHVQTLVTRPNPGHTGPCGSNQHRCRVFLASFAVCLRLQGKIKPHKNVSEIMSGK